MYLELHLGMRVRGSYPAVETARYGGPCRLSGLPLQRELTAAYAAAERQVSERQKRSLSTELSGLRLGEPIAENEAERLAKYFVATSAFQAALEPRSAVFVGRKGAGKTANFLQAASELDGDRRNLVCLIQPADYDLDGLVRTLEAAQRKDTKGYLVEALWKYLVTSEIALSVVEDIKDRPSGLQPGTPEWDLTEFVRATGSSLDRDFAVRLESIVDTLSSAAIASDSIERQRAGISEALHAGMLHDLGGLLAPVLKSYDRVAVLIDNLDQAWDAEGEMSVLSQLLLGLLASTNRLSSDLTRRSNRDVVVSLAVFIRGDIYSRVVKNAREPDKIPVRTITWSDPKILLDLVQERYVATHGEGTPRDELWTKLRPECGW